MNRLYHKPFFLAVIFCFLSTFEAVSQSPTFFHITSARGLSDNYVSSLAVDKKGFLWLGTLEGLNVFDGYDITSYRKAKEPQMASNNIIHLTCDSRNRVWQGTPEGISWVDEKRKFHRVVLYDTISRFPSRTILDTKKYGPVLFTFHGQFYFNETTKKWEKLNWIPEQLKYDQFSDAEPFEGDKIIYATRSEVIIIDYSNGKIIYEAPFSLVVSVCRYSDHEIAIAFRDGLVQVADIRTKKISKEFQLSREFNKKKISPILSEIRPAINGSMLVTTNHDGLIVINRSDSIFLYTHDPVDAGSIGSNLTKRVICSDNGDVIVGSTVAGASIFDILNRRAGYLSIFSDGKGNYYDSFISDVTEGEDGVLWMGAYEKLINWDRKRNKIRFYDYIRAPSGQGYEIRSVCIDSTGRVWVGSLGNGVSFLDKTTGQFKTLKTDTSRGTVFKSTAILDLHTASDGLIWASTTTGIFSINPVTLETDAFMKHPLLKQLAGVRINYFLEDRKGRLWMAGNSANIYCYDKGSNQMLHYTNKTGLPNGRYSSLYENKQGNIYACGTAGLTIISPEGILKTYNQRDGLRYDQCDGILEDDDGRFWISNLKCLVLFDPVRGTMKIFDQNVGLSADGSRAGSYLKTKAGELMWGSRKGINYFFPSQLLAQPPRLNVNITEADVNDSVVHIGNSEKFILSYSKRNILFRFTAINLEGSENIHYRFMLEGHDKDWQYGTDLREARYSFVPAGNYTFKIEASTDGIDWIPSVNQATVQIIPPIWQRTWFLALCALLLIVIIKVLISNRRKKIQLQREELETEQAIRHFASSLSEQQTEEDILWDVARNCIGRLQIEDCVIYMMDEKRNLLVQKAAHGPKRPLQRTLNTSLEIAPGTGIVGTVALTGKAEIIRDTSKDPRYIIGLEQRASEISVPIVYNDKVLGVIDCEHSRKGFFNQKHLSILNTIASLCANKIIRSRAEQQKKQTETILVDTQRKMTEVEMQALRAQMNPHFIFNCLNSINRYIVKSEQATASLYLTKFAKLIRLILDNSNNKNVILTNELEALKLYIEMEALRFDKKFTYEIKVEENMSTDNIEVPPLIIQPYVENSIWHGLLHKESDGHLSIRISMVGETILQCVIEDNGIGREKAKELKSKSATSRKSLGMQLTENRLSLLNKHAELNASVEIIDLSNGNGEGTGTKVILKIPI